MIDTRLIVDSVVAAARARAREQRDRDDEHPRRLRRRRTRPCARSSSSPRPTTTAASATTRRTSPRTCAARIRRGTPIENDIVEAERAVAAFAERNRGRGGDRPALRQRPRAGPARRATPRCSRCRPCRRSSASTRATSSSQEDDIAGVLEHAARHDLPGVYNAAGDGVLVLSEIGSLLGKPPAPVLPPWGTGLAAARPAPRRAADPAGDAAAAALRPRRSTTASSRPRATRSAPRRARPSRPSPSTAHARGCAGRGRGLPVRARGRGVPALEPRVRGDDHLGLGRLAPRSARGAGARARVVARGAARPPGAARHGDAAAEHPLAPARPPPRAAPPTPSSPPTRSG